PGRKKVVTAVHVTQTGASSGSAAPSREYRSNRLRSRSGRTQAVATPPATPKIHHGSASRRWPWPCESPWKISTARDGVMVSALMAEITVETAMVTANWRKNWPLTPPRKQHGRNTDV